MNKFEFYEMVLKMRNLQKEYFRTRNQSVLVDCKDIESAVDAELQEYCNFFRDELLREAIQ